MGTCSDCGVTFGTVKPGHRVPTQEAPWAHGRCVTCAVRAVTTPLVDTSDPDELAAHLRDELRDPRPGNTHEAIKASHIQRMRCCVCPACAVIRSHYPDWKPAALALQGMTEYALTQVRGICSHPDCTRAIETYCSACRVKLCRVHLGSQTLGEPVVCVACREPRPAA